MLDIPKVMSESNRHWDPKPPATEDAIRLVQQAAPQGLPPEYFQLLRYSNGGEGSLALPPLYFMLYSAEDSAEFNTDPRYSNLWPGQFTFGSNGGLERIAFDIGKPTPWPVIMFDPIAGMESSVVIAKDMATFILAIGLDSSEVY